jgi:hypothetical protein
MQKQLDKVDAWREKVKAAKIEDHRTLVAESSMAKCPQLYRRNTCLAVYLYLMPACIANASYARNHWSFVRLRVGRSLRSSPISQVRLEHVTLGAQITVNTRLESSFFV